jgi:hypothetical protein
MANPSPFKADHSYRLDEYVEAENGKTTVVRLAHPLLCGCLSDGSFVCDEHVATKSA